MFSPLEDNPYLAIPDMKEDEDAIEMEPLVSVETSTTSNTSGLRKVNRDTVEKYVFCIGGRLTHVRTGVNLKRQCDLKRQCPVLLKSLFVDKAYCNETLVEENWMKFVFRNLS